jgi:hypothetical protein
MVRSTKVLFCDNEHGSGDVTFPRIEEMNDESFIYPPTLRALRAAAKKAGWSRHAGSDYCDQCTESGL